MIDFDVEVAAGIKVGTLADAIAQSLTRQIFLSPLGGQQADLRSLLTRFLMRGQSNPSRSVSVETKVTKLYAANPARVESFVYNNGSAVVYIGDQSVTTGPIGDPHAGVPIQPSTGMIIEKDAGDLYAISGSAAQDVRVLEKIALTTIGGL